MQLSSPPHVHVDRSRTLPNQRRSCWTHYSADKAPRTRTMRLVARARRRKRLANKYWLFGPFVWVVADSMKERGLVFIWSYLEVMAEDTSVGIMGRTKLNTGEDQMVLWRRVKKATSYLLATRLTISQWILIALNKYLSNNVNTSTEMVILFEFPFFM